jgi:hypothetical protein
LDGGFWVNIIIQQLRVRLGLPMPKPTPYNLWMADQITTKLVGLIKDLRMYVHDIPYVATFRVLLNTIVNYSYSMLFGRPWLINVKATHDWGNNMITIQGNGIV